MACYHPLKGYRSKLRNPSGKRSVVFSAREGFHDQRVDLPCGQCVGCRLERSRQWAMRCVLEASLYDDNAFITLTYSDENLPRGGSLVVSDFQKFMKRLRFEFSDSKIRFFHCGEYGERLGRPHYHACLFGFDFPDKAYWRTVRDQKYFRSEKLERLWPQGQSMIGNVTFESAAYVARYITKKITGVMADEYYSAIDSATGEVFDKKPEYVTMSRRPGIGKIWFEKFSSDVYPKDFVTMRGVKMRPPRFFASQYELADPLGSAKVKARRVVDGSKHPENNTPERLAVREEIQLSRFDQLKRNFENGS